MNTIKKTQIGAETRVLKNLYNRYGKLTKEAQKILEDRGYELVDLGTSDRCFTASGYIGYKKQANCEKVDLWGIGFHNYGTSTRKGGFPCSVYRAFVKRLED